MLASLVTPAIALSTLTGTGAISDTWRDFAPVIANPCAGSTAPAYSLAPQVASTYSSKEVVFNAPVTDPTQWSTHTSAYPADTSAGHPADKKLDQISEAESRPEDGNVFAARKSDSGRAWGTDVVTTENSEGGFQVHAGDVVRATVTVCDTQGVWPAIWTWKPGTAGNSELDMFEYHSSHPKTLEFTNHVPGADNGTPTYKWLQNAITPGVPFTLEMDVNTSGVVWKLNGTEVFKGPGVPEDFSAYLMASLSIADGTFSEHPAPAASDTNVTGMKISSLDVLR